MPETFRPEAMAAPVPTRDTVPAKPKPAAQTTMPKKKTDAPTPIAAELHRRAELIARSHEMLADIERRHSELTPSQVPISESEWCILLSAGIIETRNLHDLIGVISRLRCVRVLRGDLHDMGERMPIESSLAKATKAEEAAAEKLNNIDLLSDVSEKQLKGLQSQLNGYREDRQSAERMLASYDNCFETLMRLAPEPIHAAVKTAKLMGDGKQLQLVAREADELENLLDANNPRSLLRHVESNFTNGLLDGVIGRYCDSDTVKQTAECGRQLVKSSFIEQMDSLRSEKLPQLRVERDQLQLTVDQSNHEAAGPLRDWADNGIFPIEILTRGV